MSDTAALQPVFSCEIPVRWGDMDAYGHVNNTLYFRYFEEARFLWMVEKGIPLKGDNHPVVVTIGCTFLRPIYYPETLRIDLYISEPGRSSFMVTYKVYSASQPETPAAEGYSKVVWVSSADGKSVPMPDQVRAWFAS
jgi:acyl-CoA thioester hydrolase